MRVIDTPATEDIGQWTAQYLAMRALGEPDGFPPSDLGLLRAIGLSRPRELETRAEAWRPWRAYAAMYLWSVHKEQAPRGNKAIRLSREPAVSGHLASLAG